MNHNNRNIIALIITFWVVNIPAYSQINLLNHSDSLITNTPTELTKLQKVKAHKIQETHWGKGYLDFQIDSISGSNKIYYQKGIQYFWGDVHYLKDSAPIDKPKGLVSPLNYQAFNTKMQASFRNNGFPLVKIKSNAAVKNNVIQFNYTILKGELHSFDTLALIHPKNEKTTYLENLCQIKPSNVFDQSKIDQLQSTINNSGLYEYANHSLTIDQQKITVELSVNKIKTNTFSGFIGLQPNADNKTTITGQVGLDLRNVFNLGESIKVDWERNNPQSQLLDAHLKFPFLLNSPIGALGSIFMDQQDSTFTNTKLQGGLSLFLNQSAYSSLQARYIKSTNNINDNQLLNATSVLFGMTYQSHKLNNPLNPNRGYKIDINSFAGQRSSLLENKTQTTLRLDYSLSIELYIPLRNHAVLIKNQHAAIHSDSLMKNEFLRIGGINTLRGFDENAIFAKQFNILTVEYRYILDKYSNIFVFSDYGISQESENNNLTTLNRLGFGLGMNLNTKAGILSIAVALGKQEDTLLMLNQSKIHIGYLALF